MHGKDVHPPWAAGYSHSVSNSCTSSKCGDAFLKLLIHVGVRAQATSVSAGTGLGAQGVSECNLVYAKDENSKPFTCDFWVNADSVLDVSHPAQKPVTPSLLDVINGEDWQFQHGGSSTLSIPKVSLCKALFTVFVALS